MASAVQNGHLLCLLPFPEPKTVTDRIKERYPNLKFTYHELKLTTNWRKEPGQFEDIWKDVSILFTASQLPPSLELATNLHDLLERYKLSVLTYSRTCLSRMTSQPIPLIMCGKTTQIATVVIENMKPEYEVIHLILSVDAGKVEIPAILRGESPTSSTGEGLDTRIYSRLPAAVVLGGGYDDTAIDEMRAACKDAPNQVPWLRPDLSKPAPPLGPEYGKAMVARTKNALNEILERDELLGKDSVNWY